MKAMVLAAGLGTRLGEFTVNTPKCLIEVGGKPMLEHVLLKLKQAGIKQVVINTHYLAEQVQHFVSSRASDGLKIELSHEPIILGTGGGLKQAQDFFHKEQSFLMLNADIFTDFDFRTLLKKNVLNKAIGSLLVSQRKENSYLLFDRENDRFIGWEKGDGSRVMALGTDKEPLKFAFCGIQLLSPKIFDYLNRDQRQAFSIIDTYIDAARENEFFTFKDISLSYWIDIGTPKQLEELRKLISCRRS